MEEDSKNKLNVVLSCTPDLQSLPPAARLPYCLQNWQVITSDQWVLKVVQGYQLELTSTPHQRGAPYPLVDHQHWRAVEEEVQKLLEKGAILKVEPCPGQFISRLFLVTKKDGSFRPVVNLKPLNQSIAKAHFKMEGINMLKDLLLENDWMASIDLKDAYLSVAVTAEHKKYLRFVWAEQMYEFQCLPFGLSSAPRVFTKLLKPIVGLLRRQGIRLVIFLDDMLVLAQSKEDLVIQMDQIARMFSLLGVFNQPREVTAEPNTADPISGISDRLPAHDDPAHSGEGSNVDKDLQEDPTAGESVGTRSGQAYRENDSYHSSNLPGTTKIPKLAEAKDPVSTQGAVLRGHSQSRPRCPEGVRLVDSFNGFSEWEEYFDSGTRFDNGVRCLPAGMGCSVR